MIIKRYYKYGLPPRIIRLMEWLIIVSNTQSHSHFDDVDGSTEYTVFLLSFKKVTVVIDKTNDGYITFQMEVEHE
jgi:hypothetical protein